MKKTTRKHGYAARARDIHREVHEVLQGAPRLRTQVTFETNCQSYLWITDRGRSRLIKH